MGSTLGDGKHAGRSTTGRLISRAPIPLGCCTHVQWLGLSPVFWQSKPADANHLLWTSRTPVTAPPSIEVPPRIEKKSRPWRARVADESALANAISRRTVWRRAKSWVVGEGVSRSDLYRSCFLLRPTVNCSGRCRLKASQRTDATATHFRGELNSLSPGERSVLQ